MAGTIIADFIRTDANRLSLNVGNTVVASINASGILSNTGSVIISPTGALGSGIVLNKASLPSGSVLQVVNGTVNYVTTTSSSLTDTGLSASITPTFSTSKILVLLNLVAINPAFAGSANWAFALTDGSNTVVQHLRNYNASPGTSGLQSASYSLLLSPATTSSITYKVRFSVSGGNALRLGDYSANFDPSSITLMEIAA